MIRAIALLAMLAGPAWAGEDIAPFWVVVTDRAGLVILALPHNDRASCDEQASLAVARQPPNGRFVVRCLIYDERLTVPAANPSAPAHRP